MVILSIIGAFLTIFIIFLINEIIKIIRSKKDDISDDIWAVCFFLSPSIVFLILVILELINKCS
jgi:hypothetical protein